MLPLSPLLPPTPPSQSSLPPVVTPPSSPLLPSLPFCYSLSPLFSIVTVSPRPLSLTHTLPHLPSVVTLPPVLLLPLPLFHSLFFIHFFSLPLPLLPLSTTSPFAPSFHACAYHAPLTCRLLSSLPDHFPPSSSLTISSCFSTVACPRRSSLSWQWN